MKELITEQWLADVGFKWHQFDRQPGKQWLLWLGEATVNPSGFRDGMEDLGVEVAHCGYKDDPGRNWWFCWLRSDTAHRYSRFLHVRHLQYREDLIALIEGVTGGRWNPENNFYGYMKTPEQAACLRAEHDRLDRVLLREGRPWRDCEKDSTLGGALPEHLDLAEKSLSDKRNK